MPTRFFTLVRNFRGYIKQIMLYNTKVNLPMFSSNANLEIIRDNSLLIYYKFDFQYFQANTSSYPSLANSTLRSFGPSVYVSGNLTWDSVEWDDTYTFARPSLLGTLRQNETLYDGLACYKPISLSYRANSTASSMQANMTLASNMTQATVEFWFKMPPGNSRNDSTLFSLLNLQSRREVWSIVLEAGNVSTLKCKLLKEID
jgi:hypothetical protein